MTTRADISYTTRQEDAGQLAIGEYLLETDLDLNALKRTGAEQPRRRRKTDCLGPEVEAVAQVVTPKSMTERTTLPSFMFRKPSLMSSSLIRSEIKSSRWSRPCM